MLMWIQTFMTMLAIIFSPLIAFTVAKMTEKKLRRVNIFQTLMQTRSMRNSDKHISTLNLVEIEFWENEDVIIAWNEYRYLYNQLDNFDSPPIVKKQKEEIKIQKHVELLYQISISIGYELERSDIENSNFKSLKNW